VFDNDLAAARTAVRMVCDTLVRSLNGQKLPAMPDAQVERASVLAAWYECCAGHLTAANDAILMRDKEVTEAAKMLEGLATKAGLSITSAAAVEIEAELEQAVTAAHRVVVAAEGDVETLKKRIDERKEMEKSIVEDRRTQTIYSALAGDLRADNFLAWVLGESMNQLADQASIELMRISDDRYGLVADEGSFEVVDHHNADERRSVATLSGGETFLASLSLALALSVGLRELAGTAAGRLEAIFIDEGFGALDPETLEVVVDALERLRESDRMVGVITHVPMLAERIPSGLVVARNGGSSRILTR
jgi:exonuclease SbcC